MIQREIILPKYGLFTKKQVENISISCNNSIQKGRRNMSVTIDIKVLLIALVLIALIVLIIYAVMLLRKLMVTLEHTNSILEDVETVSGIAAERSQDVDNIIQNVSGSVASISGALKGNEGTVSAIASIVKSLASLKGLVTKKADEE